MPNDAIKKKKKKKKKVFSLTEVFMEAKDFSCTRSC